MSKLAFIVDDDPAYRQYVEAFLKNFGYTCRGFSNGSDLMQSLRDNPDLVIIDHMLENDENGLDLLRLVKGEKPNVPVVYLSGQHEIEPALQAMKLGSIEYIEKNSGALVKLKSVLDQLENSKKKGIKGWFS